MGRLLGIASVTALACALLSGVVAASTMVPAMTQIDVPSQLMLRIFGEDTDAGAALAAAYGDRSSESPLRNLALETKPATAVVTFVPNDALTPTFSAAIVPGRGALDVSLGAIRARIRSMTGAGAYASPVRPVPTDLGQAGKDAEARLLATQDEASYTVGTYQPVAPLAIISPEPGSFAFGSSPNAGAAPNAPARADVPAVSFAAPGSSSSVNLAQTVHVGPEQFQGRAEGASLQSAQGSLDDASYGAGANFDVRAGARKVNVDVSSSYEHLARNDANAFSSSSLGASSGWELPGDNVPLAVPNYANMSKLALGANLALPVIKGLTLNFNYGTQRLLGGYGLPGVTNLDAINNTYTAGVTLNIPRYSSALSVTAGQQHYQDNILPANTTTTTRADVNLTVKF